MNSVMLIGRLTRDPDIRYSQNQTAVASFTVAIDRPARQGEEKTADFPRVIAFGKQAELCDRYLKKGLKVAVSGRIQTGSYVKDDQTIFTTDVVVNRIEFLEWGDEYSGERRQTQKNAPQRRVGRRQEREPAPDTFEALQEEIPF